MRTTIHVCMVVPHDNFDQPITRRVEVELHLPTTRWVEAPDILSDVSQTCRHGQAMASESGRGQISSPDNLAEGCPPPGLARFLAKVACAIMGLGVMMARLFGPVSATTRSRP